MLTEKELEIVDELKFDRDRLKSILDRFDSPHIPIRFGLRGFYKKTLRIGIISWYSGSEHSIAEDADDFWSTYAKHFDRMFPEKIKELNENVKEFLKQKLAEIDIELEKYVS